MAPNATEAGTKVCSTCLRRLPITDFRRRYAGTENRHAKCRTCFASEIRGRKAARRRGEFYRFETGLLRARTDHQLARIVSGMVRRLGGEDAVAEQWHQCLELARKERKDHLVMRGFLAMWKMWLAAERLAPPVNQLTAEERTEIVRAEIAKIIGEHPEAVLWVATTMPDWTVIPPPGVELGDSADLDA